MKLNLLTTSILVLIASTATAGDFTREDERYISPEEWAERTDPLAPKGPVASGSPFYVNEYEENSELPKISAYLSNWGFYARGVDLSKFSEGYDKIILSFFGMCGSEIGDSSNTSAVESLERLCGFAKDANPEHGKDFEVLTTDAWADMATDGAGVLTEAEIAAVGNPNWEEEDVLLQRWYQGEDRVAGFLGAMKKLKGQNPDLAVAFSVGGWSLSEPFSRMAADPDNRAIFIASVVEIFKRFTFFSQIDLDWEYPGGGGADGNSSSDADGENYATLIRELRSALDDAGLEEVEIAIAAPAPVDKIQAGDIGNVYRAGVDTIHLMTYDFFGTPWAESLAHHTNTFPYAEAEWSADDSISYLIESMNVPSQAIQIGYATYSRNATEAQVSSFSPLEGSYSMPSDPDVKVGGSWEPGIYEWYDIEQTFASISESDGFQIDKIESYNLYTDAHANADYIYSPDRKFFISLDTPRTAYMKAKYVEKYNLGGIFTWMADYDNGILLNAAREGLGYQQTDASGNIDMNNIIYSCGTNITSPQQCRELTNLEPENAETAADAGADMSSELESGVQYTLDGSQSTSAQGALTYAWSLVDVEGTDASAISIDDSTQATTHFTVSDVDSDVTATFQLTVTDEAEASSSDTMVYTLTVPTPDNQPPVADAGQDQSITRGDSFTLNGSNSSDPEGEELSYQWVQTQGQSLPLEDGGAKAVIEVDSNSLRNYDQTLAFTLTVSDGSLEDSDSVTIAVSGDADANDDPHADVAVTVEGGEIHLDGSKSSDDGRIESFSWSGTAPNGDVLTIPGSDQPTTVYTPEMEGEFNFSLNVTDNFGATDSANGSVNFTFPEGDSCEPQPDPDAGNHPAWDSSAQYPDSGTLVSHNGFVWQNQWYANVGEEPGVADVWELVSDVVLPWDDSKSYAQYSEVTHDGYFWVAAYWASAGDEPGVAAMWEQQAACN
ncbi:glycosyl hydrolase family 18 protein [Vibrio coralliilyticus]|uniref:chitinase n=1 Tax=Vibrio coralliilyticus TaxID=190893 RepID=A0AAP7DDE6_9VIBR|nr:glycosyl hydrolase family 18 protein [Vibrio coralliilyticus]NOJ22330.1 chitinase [Vibrio coralliilyticus]